MYNEEISFPFIPTKYISLSQLIVCDVEIFMRTCCPWPSWIISKLIHSQRRYLDICPRLCMAASNPSRSLAHLSCIVPASLDWWVILGFDSSYFFFLGTNRVLCSWPRFDELRKLKLFEECAAALSIEPHSIFLFFQFIFFSITWDVLLVFFFYLLYYIHDFGKLQMKILRCTDKSIPIYVCVFRL